MFKTRTLIGLALWASLASLALAEHPSQVRRPSPRRSTRGGVVRVKGRITKRGTYVAPHLRTRADHWALNNWSSKGNVNPFTGKRGSKKWP